MTSKIFKYCMISAIVAIIVTIGLFFNVLYHEFENSTMDNLKEEVALVKVGVDHEGIAYFDDVNVAQRVTIIDQSGEVIYDNVTDEEDLEDHSDREEVIEALDSGWGYATRYSESIGKQSIYVATLLENGDILRISTTADTTTTVLLRMSVHIVWIVLIVMVVTFLIAHRLAKKIVKPINEIDLDGTNLIAPYKELNPLYSKVERQNYTISKQLNELQKRQDEFKLIVRNMNEGIIMINKEANIITINHAMKALFKIDDIDVGDSVYEIYRSQDFMKAVEEVLAGHKQNIHIEKDKRIFDVIMGPAKNDEEEVEGATIIIFDITEKELQEKMRREFSANVSHELKTPLTTISGFAEIMKNGVADINDTKELAGNIYDEAQRLIKLVEDIIHLSSLDAKAKVHEHEEIDLKKLTNEIFDHQNPSADKKKISLEVDGEAKIIGSYSVLEEMINNLVDNAIKYGNEGGYVKVILKEDERNTYISVEDNGIGIPADSKDRIFERFYRVDKSRSKELGGTGLGLSIVKHAVLYHDGEITVDSDIKKGTTFKIILPKKD